jgi:hypothetical protein
MAPQFWQTSSGAPISFSTIWALVLPKGIVWFSDCWTVVSFFLAAEMIRGEGCRCRMKDSPYRLNKSPNWYVLKSGKDR